MADIKVRLDVTGFYFSETVTADETELQTVKDVMLKLVSKTAGTDKEFAFKSLFTAKGEFCSQIRINYKNDLPKSRQVIQKEGGGEERFPTDSQLKPGGYGFDDENQTGMNPQLAWQYYVVADNGLGVLRTGEIDGKRTVVPFSESNRANAGVVLQDNDVIIWRLVAICNGPTDPSTSDSESLMGRLASATGFESSTPSATPLKYQRAYGDR